MQEFHDKKWLLELIHQGAIVISPNNRLSAAVLHSYFTVRQQNTLVKPQCLPYKQMLLKLFAQIRFNHYQPAPPMLLNEAQCRYLWLTILQETEALTYSEGLLSSVMQAWKQCEQWLVQPENSSFSYTPQTQLFQKWWQTFNKRVQDLQGITEYQLVSYLIKTQAPLFNKPLIWLCFDEFTPEQALLQAHLGQQGIAQYRYDLAENHANTRLCAAENNKEECQQLIQWLKLKLEEGKQRLGVVLPELQQGAQGFKRLLSQHFDPTLFNISLGEPLNDYPLVAHGLSWLALETELNPHQAALLLQSPYLSAAKEEFLPRAQFLQDNNLIHQSHFSLKQLKQHLSISVPKLSNLLNNLTPYPAFASVNAWITLFQKRLNDLGFPGDLGLNSIQYQCYQRFVALFDEFRQLAVIKAEFSKNEALHALTQLARNTIFQAQKKNAPIQISGLLEASGCEFDGLWVMGLTDQCLPGSVQLSAFIPPQLQREQYMPHSTAARELYFARQTLQRLQRGSPSVVFSYSRLDGDKPNLPSALISHFPLFCNSIIKLKNAKEVLTHHEESYSLPLKEKELLSGGTALLANQAKCPFKAFAEHRLKAKPVLKNVDGLDNKERGKIIHKIMELLWHDLTNQAQLFAYPQDRLEQLIANAIKQALKQQAVDSPHFIQDLEYCRLKRLVLSYLEWEKQRPAFVIAGLEQSYTLNLSGLEIKVRVDRLDKVGDKTWVIDYKSTLPSTKPWNEERPQEPQLLLYALLDEEINTLILMQIKAGKILCTGLSETKTEIKGINSLRKEESWHETRENWQEQLSRLAQEVLNGYCPPQPINPNICSYCDFKNLCRIDN
ncbi:PD-(D/E)XK nuclease family protein [Legionella sp. km772]|uniref:PD-(D/E)XK nuclease family protein n=1 Tax=Legionella sp. km772 TaxID=2498111 RepID=UPI000F8D0A86|nr:PD-(D/E)XK nuclease family protein [Legionella sp. km772]RUR13748.1 PD-(D/E)XK nuclease family protein [Legionella sp. km772]